MEKTEAKGKARTITVSLPSGTITENNIPQETIEIVEVKACSKEPMKKLGQRSPRCSRPCRESGPVKEIIG